MVRQWAGALAGKRRSTARKTRAASKQGGAPHCAHCLIARPCEWLGRVQLPLFNQPSTICLDGGEAGFKRPRGRGGTMMVPRWKRSRVKKWRRSTSGNQIWSRKTCQFRSRTPNRDETGTGREADGMRHDVRHPGMEEEKPCSPCSNHTRM
ncbi:hypothetical protein K402DRAFT_54138 [Aulographum hederae CBS 113979]|uniref:Uncharacterized protein n=1 Tax=Aulographum hederae CBS 113979 TaxID=1176131 RepID=A0A6G1H2G9_9PEZI|nr:hypothetical protein K402DRAFT_54138 [Aulographum hederae CBS 113979]